ncbi:MAG: FtsX-like permease family protein [Clostridiales bacterium]|nr:FtsX-like permease family protein [Clostridiales bacterium]
MNRALVKDIFRTIGHEKKRFVSIMVITALGVAMLTGLRAACNDLRWSADALFDEQSLFDIQVSSTLGLTDDDVDALAALDDVLAAEGEFSESVFTEVEGSHSEALVRTLGSKINIPTVLEGTLPETADEIAVTQTYLDDTGKKPGDTLEFTEEIENADTDPYFKNTEFVITASVLDPFDINNTAGACSFRSTSTTDYTFFVAPAAVDTDIYTSVYVTVAGASELMCYEDEYNSLIENVRNEINTTLKSERQQARYDRVYGEAMDEYNDAYDEAMSAIDDAQAGIDDGRKEIADAQAKIDDGWEQYNNGVTQLEDGKSELESQEASANAQIASAQAQINDGYSGLDEVKTQLDEAAETIADGQAQLDAAQEELDAAKEETLTGIDEGMAQITDKVDPDQIDELKAQLQTVIHRLTAMGDTGSETLKGLEDQLSELEAAEEALQQLEAARNEALAQFDAAQAEIDDQQVALDAGRQQYEDGLTQWQAGKDELDAAQAELDKQAASGRAQIAGAWETINESEQELQDAYDELTEGQAELDNALKEVEDGQRELDDNKEEALSELADAKAGIDDIEMAKWYIQSRTSLSGYSNVDSDSTSIEAFATFLPVIFLVVAILISLTAITRMVEEERGLIGTYKALGFNDHEIRGKYVLFGAASSLSGGIIGVFCGFVVLPKIIFSFFAVMYTLPYYLIRLMPAWAIVGVFIFVAGVLLAILYAVEGNLREAPAELMRPETPKVGKRILIERIPAFWKRLSFLNKVTARNLFRYKKRMAMTIIGIMGCTGLLVCSFAIRNTVTDLMPKQYENVNRYDILAVALATDNDRLVSYMDDTENIDGYINLEVDSVSIENNDGEEMSVQMLVIPEGAEISDFIKIADTKGNETGLATDGIMVTRSIGDVPGLSDGSSATIMDLSLNETNVDVSMVTENYLGDMIYVSETYYDEHFGQQMEQNAVLVRLTDSCNEDDPVAYSKELGARDGVISTISTQTLKDEFSQAFTLINVVVYVILVMAAALAFVVLFTLSTTNISERQRELATIKVLGFFDREVHLYVNKETLILAAIGTVLGLPAGYVFIRLISLALKIPSVYFDISVHVSTYVICAAISMAFALIVNFITNGILNRIDPAEALKSVE